MRFDTIKAFGAGARVHPGAGKLGLRRFVGQVQFPPILRLEKGVEAIADFQDAIRHLFPGFGVQHQIQVILTQAGTEADTATTRAAAYRFTNGVETWSALLAPTALTLEATAGGRYSSFREFAELFEALWLAALEHLRPASISQQGLRYVDHLEGDRSPNEWAECINPELLGGMAGHVLGEGLQQAVCELVYPREQGQLLFRHGLVEAGPERVRGYLLDFDSLHTGPFDTDDVAALIARFGESHELLYRFFRWCVTDRALEEFRHAGN